MEKLKNLLTALPTLTISGRIYLPYQAVTDTVATFLFPDLPAGQIDEARYQHILETAGTLCEELGYSKVAKLTPPDVPLSAMGLYWTATDPSATEPETFLIYAGPGRVEMLEEGHLPDAHLSRLGLDEVTRQHFKIPVTASEGVIDLLHRAVSSDWPNDYKGLWHDILGMCIAGGKDISPSERLFTVIIRGLGRRRYRHFKACLQHDLAGALYLTISLVDKAATTPGRLFELGQVVMTHGAAELNVDFTPYLARHAAGDYGDLDAFDRRQNDIAVKKGSRILSAYDVPRTNGETERIWLITEADRSCTTILLPAEY